MKRLKNLLSRRNRRTNEITYWERRRFAKSMAGETAATSAARLGCIAG